MADGFTSLAVRNSHQSIRSRNGRVVQLIILSLSLSLSLSLFRAQVTLMTVDWKNDVSRPCSFPIKTDFPGDAAGGALVLLQHPVALTLSCPGWLSTGMYLPPGGVLTVSLPEGSTESLSGWSVQIGCHSDSLWSLSEWKRWPEIVIRVDLKSKRTVSSPFGGLVYFKADARAAEQMVFCSGAVAAPFFTQASADQWQ